MFSPADVKQRSVVSFTFVSRHQGGVVMPHLAIVKTSVNNANVLENFFYRNDHNESSGEK